MRVRDSAKVAPLWHKALVLMCIGCILIFSFCFVMDIETTRIWTGLRSRKLLGTHHGYSSLIHPVVTRDDTKCLARTQHLLYRNDPERYAASPELDAAWKRYGELHKACSYKKNWTDVFLNGREKHDDCSYLVLVEGGAGLGNRLLTLISAFTYALATDRVLLVDSRKSYANLLCEPFPGSSWLLPKDFPYDDVESGPSLGPAIDKQFKNISMVNLHLDHIQGWADQQFFCDHIHHSLIDVRWLGWRSNQYYVTRLFMVPSLWERLDPMFSSKSQVFMQLSHHLLLPRNEIWGHILRVYWGYLSCSRTRVGLQIRLHGRSDLGAFDSRAQDRILDCLQAHKVIPGVRKEEAAKELSNLFNEKWDNPSADISVLVASLQRQYFEELRDLYGQNPNDDNAMIRFHMVSNQMVEVNSDYQQHLAFVEMWLLSFSDVIATSAYSTFGYIAQGLGGLKPLILNIRGENSTANGQEVCWVGQSLEPCTHNPMKPKCQSSEASAEHSEWMRQHLKECQDHEGGLQLVEKVQGPSSASLWEFDD